MEEDVEIVEENDEYYLIKDSEGKERKLYKINMDQLAEMHKQRIQICADRLDKEDVDPLINQLSEILSRTISVDEYLEIACNISAKLEDLYAIMGSGNIFHSFIKQLDPYQYGRAQTFTDNVESLLHTLSEIRDCMGD